MPKVTDIKAYWNEIAGKAGLSEEELKLVGGVLDNPKFAKAFTDNFKPLPDYSHDLDDVRAKTKAEKDKEYDAWFKKEQEKYGEYVSGIDKLKKYEEIYGPIDPNNPPDANDLRNNRGGKMISQEDIDKLVETKLTTVLNDTLARRDSAVLDLLEIRETHMNTFKKSLDVKEFEKSWKEHPEWGGSMKQAYKEYVGPDLEKIKNEDIDARIKAAREEGIRDGYSRRSMPIDNANKQFSPMFDRNVNVDKMSEREQENHSRNAFFDGLREGVKQP